MRRGLTLAELVLAISILAVSLLALFTLCLSALRVQSKSSNTVQAVMVAERELSQAVYMSLSDNPPGSLDELFDSDFPYPSVAWRTGVRRAGATDFHYAIYAETLRDTAGNPIGTATGNTMNRVKK
ncbi:MAG: hypothetical protein AB1758_27175, partial [Candidatus Eremiobacterota bacterium]